ncbi:MAG: hypothetical protein LBT46_15275 [Planctomycetaceae bacterium]|nr:hypothetical protein [Planctomycetaceae bacterium]
MSTELTAKAANPFGNPEKQGKAVSQTMQTKAASEVQASVFMAKQFPRDQRTAMDNILNECQRESLAAQAVYTYARGGTNISGASIRLAETIAACWGNIDTGVVELERTDGESTVLSYAWDLETNYRSQKTFTVSHVRDTKRGSQKLTDGRDIYEHIANNAARRLRSCILAVIPGDIVDAAVEQCNKTLNAKADTSAEGIKKLLDSFAKFDVNKEMIEKRIQRRIDAIQPAQVVQLRNIYTSIKDGMSTVSDWFDTDEETQSAVSSPKAKLAAALDKKEPEKEPIEVEIVNPNPDVLNELRRKVNSAPQEKMFLLALQKEVSAALKAEQITDDQASELNVKLNYDIENI